ncbi:MAG: RnfABCDGE type electron transport complex subunit D [Coleofasciculus chthonoplastes F3-SA18-01]|uniref:RnfABCDGE type electron transport complex subunit D n=1 Tax=Coleofasciculus chthonoplastes TaxID=64178 RepID=UPI0032F3A039
MQHHDPRDYQILFLSLFLVLGIGTRDWTLQPQFIGVAIATCLLTQYISLKLWSISKSKLRQGGFCTNVTPKPAPTDAPWHVSTLKTSLISLKSAMITALGLSLLLRVDQYSTMILAGVLAILSKFLFRFQGKHFLNPANFGIISVLILTKDAWVSPGQWGEGGWYVLLFAGTGGMILKRVGRWDTTAAFCGTYALLEAVRNLWLGWTWDVWAHRLMSGSFLLFALFMLTDPRSIPNARVSRLLWAVSIAILTFILRNHFFMSTAVFWALFALSPLTLLLDWIWSSPRFVWRFPGYR